jgi:hypothetical protein
MDPLYHYAPLLNEINRDIYNWSTISTLESGQTVTPLKDSNELCAVVRVAAPFFQWDKNEITPADLENIFSIQQEIKATSQHLHTLTHSILERAESNPLVLKNTLEGLQELRKNVLSAASRGFRTLFETYKGLTCKQTPVESILEAQRTQIFEMLLNEIDTSIIHVGNRYVDALRPEEMSDASSASVSQVDNKIQALDQSVREIASKKLQDELALLQADLGKLYTRAHPQAPSSESLAQSKHQIDIVMIDFQKFNQLLNALPTLLPNLNFQANALDWLRDELNEGDASFDAINQQVMKEINQHRNEINDVAWSNFINPDAAKKCNEIIKNSMDERITSLGKPLATAPKEMLKGIDVNIKPAPLQYQSGKKALNAKDQLVEAPAQFVRDFPRTPKYVVNDELIMSSDRDLNPAIAFERLIDICFTCIKYKRNPQGKVYKQSDAVLLAKRIATLTHQGFSVELLTRAILIENIEIPRASEGANWKIAFNDDTIMFDFDLCIIPSEIDEASGNIKIKDEAMLARRRMTVSLHEFLDPELENQALEQMLPSLTVQDVYSHRIPNLAYALRLSEK